MMGLGYLGNGGSSSSSSNLSPLAPPFTVDRSNPKSNSNPVTNFTEQPPYGVPFSSSLHNWQYSHSSASRPDFGSNCHSEIDSMCTTSLPSANNYHYLGSESINPPSTQWAPPNRTLSNATNPFSCAPKHYYPPYASQVVADDTLLVGLNETNYDLLSTSGLATTVGSSQADYTKGLSGLEFPPPWGGFWNGLAEGKQGRRTEIDGSFCLEESTDVGSLVFKDYTKQGAVPVECLRKCEENPALSHSKYDDVLERENLALSKGQLNDNFLAQSLGFIPSESSKAPILGSGAISTESHLESPSLEPATFSCNRSYSPYEKRFQLFKSCTNDCISVTKSSPTVTIRPPAFGAKSSASDTVSAKSVDIGNVAAANSKNVSSHNLSIKKVPHLPPGSEGKEGCLDANPLSFHIGRNDHHIFAASSSTKEDQSNKLLFRNALDHPIKARFGAQVPDVNVSHGFSLAADITEAFKHTSNSSESLDNHNPAEDSPCWKGAPASHVSPFETLEAMPLQHLMKKSEACVGLNFQGSQNFPPYNDSVTPFSREVCETSLQKESLCIDCTTSLRPKRSFNSNSPAKEHTAGDAARTKSDGVELNKSDGLQILDNVDNPIKEYDLLNGLKSDSVSLHFHTKQPSPKEVKITSERKPDIQTGFVDVGFSTSDTLEDGCVPLHVVENVLCSPSSVEDAVKLHGMESSPKINVQMLVNAMHNLSELLLFHCSNDACALKKQDCKALEHAMKNIDTCLSKKIAQSTLTQESVFPREEGSSQLFEEVPNLHSGASVLRSRAMNEVGTASHGQLDSHCINEQKRECVISGKKFEKNLDFVSSRDDADITRHHNMVQDIRKVLDENFQLEEEIPSEAMLFKNLWLDAEAELCSIGFRARFDRVKIQMENCKSYKAKEDQMAVEKLPSSIISPDLNNINTSTPEPNDDNPWQKASVQYSCISSPTSHVDDVEASVMARFHILKSRGGNSNTISVEEKQLPEVVEVGFSRKRNQWQNIGNQFQNKTFDVVVGSHLQHHIGHNNNEDKAGGSDPDDPRNETMKEVRLRVTDGRIIQPYNRNNSLQNQLASGSGCFDSNSSDWEHVLKDDFA